MEKGLYLALFIFIVISLMVAFTRPKKPWVFELENLKPKLKDNKK